MLPARTHLPGETEVLPHNIEAEQQLLGAILTNNDVFDRIASLVKAEHFYEPVHARIFEMAAARIQKNALASPVTLKAFFEDDEGLKELGGPAYLARLAGAAISALCGARLRPDDLRPRGAARADRARAARSPPRPAKVEVESEPREQIVEAEQRALQAGRAGQSQSGIPELSARR